MSLPPLRARAKKNARWLVANQVGRGGISPEFLRATLTFALFLSGRNRMAIKLVKIAKPESLPVIENKRAEGWLSGLRHLTRNQA